MLLETLITPHSVISRTRIACSRKDSEASGAAATADITDDTVNCRVWAHIRRGEAVLLAMDMVVMMVVVRMVGMALIRIRVLTITSIVGHGFIQISILTMHVRHAAAAAKAADHIQEAVENRLYLRIVMLTLLPSPGITMIVEAVLAMQVLLDISFIGVGVVGTLSLLGSFGRRRRWRRVVERFTRVVLGTNDFDNVPLALRADQAMLVAVPLVGASVTEHHLSVARGIQTAARLAITARRHMPSLVLLWLTLLICCKCAQAESNSKARDAKCSGSHSGQFFWVPRLVCGTDEAMRRKER